MQAPAMSDITLMKEKQPGSTIAISPAVNSLCRFHLWYTSLLSSDSFPSVAIFFRCPVSIWSHLHDLLGSDKQEPWQPKHMDMVNFPAGSVPLVISVNVFLMNHSSSQNIILKSHYYLTCCSRYNKISSLWKCSDNCPGFWQSFPQ